MSTEILQQSSKDSFGYEDVVEQVLAVAPMGTYDVWIATGTSVDDPDGQGPLSIASEDTALRPPDQP